MDASFNRFELQMTLNQAKSVSHSGDCLPDVLILLEDRKIIRQLNKIPAEKIAQELKEYGAWDEEELSDTVSNLQRIVWIAGCDISEEYASRRK